MTILTRAEAVSQVARCVLDGLDPAKRAKQVESMLRETWDADEEWHRLPEDLRAEVATGELRAPTSNNRYDPLLLLGLRSRYEAALNVYLKTCLEGYGIPVESIIGEPPARHPCPCCGRSTLEGRGCYDICTVCWWEDDGQDDSNADTVKGGPNYHLSLTQGRVNFLLCGISDPRRTDLRSHQDPIEMYGQGRTFRLSEDHSIVMEKNGVWTSASFQLMTKEVFDLESSITGVEWSLTATRDPVDPVRDLLREDLIQVSFRNGMIVDVGWYPEFSPRGNFRLVAVKDDWDTPLRQSTCRSLAELQTRLFAYLDYARMR